MPFHQEHFAPLEPEVEKVVRKLVSDAIPFNKLLGIEVELARKGYVRLRVDYRHEFIGNPLIPALHGGFLAAVLDVAGGAAALTTLSKVTDRISTVDMRIDYIRFGMEKDIIAEGHVLRTGNRIVVTEMSIRHEDDDDTLAFGRGVFNVRKEGE